ncbi:MAG TPA: FtsX-like permease family protein [Steroidobacteraceae bacterium]|nr:FtsX-like permease family protein [Steroidobacteraceae bacterium]
MSRNKTGVILAALQMGVTLAILCNALSVIGQRLAPTRSASGVAEASLFVIESVRTAKDDVLESRIRADLAALRSLPNVVDAYATNSYPFANGGMVYGLALHPDAKPVGALGAVYFADEHALHTLGTKLVAGRNFNTGDVVPHRGADERPVTDGIIVSQALADRLAPGGLKLGETAALDPIGIRAPIIGIIDTLQVPWPVGSGVMSGSEQNSMLLPYLPVSSQVAYVVRTVPERLSSVMTAARSKLLGLDHRRIIESVRSLSESRRDAYRDATGMATLLAIVCLMVLTVTALGMVGLTSYLVTQRRRQIGIRRALGATRRDITRHFQIENLLIAASGVTVGVAIAVGANLWLVNHYQIARLNGALIVVGAGVVLILSQLAALRPALKAARVPPAEAARGI